MKINLVDFINLPNEEQLEIVFLKGKCLEIRIEEDRRYLLYAVDLFFVEVEYSSKENSIRKNRAFVAGELLDKYAILS